MLQIVQHPLFQRLTRIKQLGLTYMVFPGAQHTRFQHSLGAFHLMSEALLTLQQKGIFIFDSEAEAVCAAILMHDIGHAPFSHVLEDTLIRDISHEDISIMMMQEINKDLVGQLNLAINIFKGEYQKKFLHQLISSQLDMDRLDYLRRDSFFTGVNEGNIGSARIIKMLDVIDDNLCVDHKGIYSIENYLTSRRLMYWQVYLHKTTVGAERLLINTLKRAKDLVRLGKEVFATPALQFFLRNNIDREWFYNEKDTLKFYEQLDDNDIWTSVKVWATSNDPILSLLAYSLINRKLFKVEVNDKPFEKDYINEKQEKIAKALGIDIEDTKYFISQTVAKKDMYDINDDHISMLFNDGTIRDITDVSDLLNINLLSKKIRKYYLCYQRI
jgi:HD superfamily phosphohydrolase